MQVRTLSSASTPLHLGTTITDLETKERNLKSLLLVLSISALAIPTLLPPVIASYLSRTPPITTLSMEGAHTLSELPQAQEATLMDDSSSLAYYFKNQGVATTQQQITQEVDLPLLAPSIAPSIQRVAAGTKESVPAVLGVSKESNALQGTATLPAGETSLFVSSNKIQDTTQLYLVAKDSTVVLYVASKESGKGFTIQATQASTTDTAISWYEIE